jgi:hypothetical protein
MAAGHKPVDWPEFMTLVRNVDDDIHQGTMGWADESFYAPVLKFVTEQKAPPDMIAAIKFLRAVSSYNWIEASNQIDPILFAIENKLNWILPDTFRDAAVVSLLKTGQFVKARTLFNNMGAYTDRKVDDLRVRMLGAAVAAVVVPAADSTAAPPAKR